MSATTINLTARELLNVLDAYRDLETPTSSARYWTPRLQGPRQRYLALLLFSAISI